MAQNNSQKSYSEEEAVAILTRRAQRIIRKQHRFEELNLVPYMDVMVNLIIFLLVTTSTFLPMGMLSIFPFVVSSKVVNQPEVPKVELNFTVFITKTGFTLGGAGGILEPIPKNTNGEYDYNALAQKAVEVKDIYPNQNMVILCADQDIQYDILVKTMDTLRETNNRLLFDDVQLSPGFINNP